MSAETIQATIERLQHDIAQLQELAAPRADAIRLIREIHSDVFSFGWYDPASAKDEELGRMIWPKLQELKRIFQVND